MQFQSFFDIANSCFKIKLIKKTLWRIMHICYISPKVCGVLGYVLVTKYSACVGCFVKCTKFELGKCFVC